MNLLLPIPLRDQLVNFLLTTCSHLRVGEVMPFASALQSLRGAPTVVDGAAPAEIPAGTSVTVEGPAEAPAPEAPEAPAREPVAVTDLGTNGV